MMLKAIVVLNPLKIRLKEKWKRLKSAILIQRQWGWFKYRCRYIILYKYYHYINIIIIIYYSYLFKIELLNVHKRIRFIYLPEKSFVKIINIVKKIQSTFRKQKVERQLRASFIICFYLKMRVLRKRFLVIRPTLPGLNKFKGTYRAWIQRRKYLAMLHGIHIYYLHFIFIFYHYLY